MKRTLIAAILMLLIFQGAEGQMLWKRYRYEVVGSAGMTQFFGDIGGYTQGENALGFKDISFNQSAFNFNGQLRYRIIEPIALKLSFTYGMFRATDEKGSNEGRELGSVTHFIEPMLIGEYYFIKSGMENSYLFQRGKKSRFRGFLSTIDVFAFTGVGALNYGVKPNEALAERGLPTSGFTAVIPLGVGANVLMATNYSLGIELGGRYAFSDYLDGYTSQFSNSNDVYYFLNLTFTYKILTSKRTGLPEFMSRKRRR